MPVKAKLDLAIETKADGSKVLDLLGKTRIELNSEDAALVAGLLIQSKAHQSECPLVVLPRDY